MTIQPTLSPGMRTATDRHYHNQINHEMILADALQRDLRLSLEDPFGVKLTLAVFPHGKIHMIINSHCEADGFPLFLLELAGPASERCAQT